MSDNDLFGFGCKKWTLFTLCLLGVVSTLIIIIAASVQINKTDHMDGIKDQDLKAGKRVAIAIIASIGTISIIVQLFGLCGALRESYCLTLTYAIIMTIVTLLMILPAARGSGAFWFTFVLNILITILAYLLARDLRQGYGTHGSYA
ncbi:tetraspanin-8-like [Oppia nitens]|uniref:tetraspanin-8-like n=1 Tax=Oppia nitens TaxID=1686743 RepID=UPI0023DBB8B6|nr:tetraspanin-8-like [Oppia nitens]